ncbi:MAG: hypothetical protein AAF603_08655 [Pseudomonadota bacterium]
MIYRILYFILTTALLSPVSAQSLTPMEARITTYTDKAAIRVIVNNPYPNMARFLLSVRHADGTPFHEASLSREDIQLAASKQTSILAIIPMQIKEKDFSVCMSTIPDYQYSSTVIGRVCGTYSAIQKQF